MASPSFRNDSKEGRGREDSRIAATTKLAENPPFGCSCILLRAGPTCGGEVIAEKQLQLQLQFAKKDAIEEEAEGGAWPYKEKGSLPDVHACRRLRKTSL